jgi:putative sterol carrier protein
MSEIPLTELMARMPKAFIPEKAEGMEAVVQYELSGEEGGNWVITIKDGACSVEEGVTENPKMTLTADAQDYKDVVLGKQNAMQAFMQGKLKLKGDLNLAMKLTSFFRLS